MPEIVKSNPVNDPTQKPVKTHSKFTPNFSLYTTQMFGLNSPIIGIAGVADDDISLRVNADQDTYTLKAPLMQPVRKSTDYFQLPLRALLPHGAELLITNPLFGDDISAPDVNAILSKTALGTIATRVRQAFFTILQLNVPDLSTNLGLADFRDYCNYVFHLYQVGNLFFSKGNILKNLHYSLDDLIKFQVSVYTQSNTYDFEMGFDQLLDVLMAPIRKVFETPGTVMMVRMDRLRVTGTNGAQITTGTYSEFLNIVSDSIDGIRTNKDMTYSEFIKHLVVCPEIVGAVSDFEYNGSNPFEGATPTTDKVEVYVRRVLSPDYSDVSGPTVVESSPARDINLLRPLAYQMACAEFYTNDKVDGIYSAKLFDSNQLAIVRYLANLGSVTTNYLQNGIPVEYDAHAGHFLSAAPVYNNLLSILSTVVGPTSTELAAWAYWHNLLGYTRSMKYEDYFVGSKTRPLAVGDVSVGVDTGSNTIDVIDVTKKIQVQRFLNQVNRVGRKFSDYVKGILGDKPMKDVHEPIFLGHVVDTFGAEETNNTGEGQLTLQNSTTSKLRNNSNRFGFDVHCGEPSILIGIVNYDVVRVYSTTTDRENFHVDRYDMFNPFMQFVGDQEVFGSEINFSETSPFGYQMRYMEYKQKYDFSAGGFANRSLPGYARIIKGSEIPSNINSDFLRSKPWEIDEFYISLTGNALANNFHFIVRYDVSITARRPMSFAPSIL